MAIAMLAEPVQQEHMLQVAAPKAQGRLKEYFSRAVIGPRLLIVVEVGYLPFGREAVRGIPVRARLASQSIDQASAC